MDFFLGILVYHLLLSVLIGIYIYRKIGDVLKTSEFIFHTFLFPIGIHEFITLGSRQVFKEMLQALYITKTTQTRDQEDSDASKSDTLSLEYQGEVFTVIKDTGKTIKFDTVDANMAYFTYASLLLQFRELGYTYQESPDGAKIVSDGKPKRRMKKRSMK